MSMSLRLSTATSVMAISVALSSAAVAQALPDAIVTPSISTDAGTPVDSELSEASAPVLDIDDATGVVTSTTTQTGSSATNFTQSDSFTIEGGEYPVLDTDVSLTASATVTQPFTVSTVTTSTPDGDGGFIVTGPTAGAPVDSGAAVTSGLSVSADYDTEIQVMSDVDLRTVSSSGNDAILSATVGVVNTSSVTYADLSGTATFDPATGEIATAVTGGTAAQLNADGLTTLGADFRGVVNAAAQNSEGFFVSAASPAQYSEPTTAEFTIQQEVGGTTVDGGATYTDLFSTDFVVFDDEPDAAVISALGEAGFTFDEDQGRWERASVDFVAPDGADSAEFSALAGDAAEFSEVVGVEIAGGTLLPAGPTLSSQLTADGLVTSGSVSATSIDVNGGIISNVADGVADGDAVNVGQLDAEATTRADADTALGTRITTEATTRADADTALQTAIDTERTDRVAAVSAEAATRSTAVTTLTNNLAAEASARQAADLALGTRIDAVNTRVGALETRVDDVARAASAGTAVAVALSGAAFLPDVKYNLTANVATYDGAHAVAAQFGAMVSKNIAVNAGIATSLNRGGKTAARAGFTFGW